MWNFAQMFGDILWKSLTEVIWHHHINGFSNSKVWNNWQEKVQVGMEMIGVALLSYSMDEKQWKVVHAWTWRGSGAKFGHIMCAQKRLNLQHECVAWYTGSMIQMNASDKRRKSFIKTPLRKRSLPGWVWRRSTLSCPVSLTRRRQVSCNSMQGMTLLAWSAEVETLILSGWPR